MMIYRFRIVLDVLDDVFRDIEIKADDTLEDLHNSIVQAFGFEGSEMASFYQTDKEWNQGEEFMLFDMGDDPKSNNKRMNETAIDTVVSKESTKLIYVYDFLSLWTFYVELAETGEEEVGKSYPSLMFSHGILPETPPEKNFESDTLDLEEEDFHEDGLGDNYIDLDSLDDLDSQQWN